MRINPTEVELRVKVDDEFIRYELWWCSKRIGYANVHNSGAIVEIADLRIADLAGERRKRLRNLREDWHLNIYWHNASNGIAENRQAIVVPKRVLSRDGPCRPAPEQRRWFRWNYPAAFERRLKLTPSSARR